jgi:hypothetical protein
MCLNRIYIVIDVVLTGLIEKHYFLFQIISRDFLRFMVELNKNIRKSKIVIFFAF